MGRRIGHLKLTDDQKKELKDRYVKSRLKNN